MTATDFLTQGGAETLMRRIRLFWKERGYSVVLWVELVQYDRVNGHGAYCVRSDLVNGMPRTQRVA